MNTSCQVTADSKMIVSFFFNGCFLSIIGCLLNGYSCLIFTRTKSLVNTPYAIFIIALSIADIIKLITEYYIHLLFLFIRHPYFVCSICWFFTMASENSSYGFLIALGIERNIKVWTIDRHWLITRQRARLITFSIILIVTIYNHPFLYFPIEISYCYFTLFNTSMIYKCDNAWYKIYGYSFTLRDLLFIENVGLNNILLPLMILLTNIILIIGLRRRDHQRRYQFGRNKSDDSKERSVILYLIFSSINFLLLTSPIGILGLWGILSDNRLPTNNLSFVFNLMKIVHHCSHFPILFMTSSMIRRNVFQSRLQRRKLITKRQRCYTPASHPMQPLHFPRLLTSTTASCREHP